MEAESRCPSYPKRIKLDPNQSVSGDQDFGSDRVAQLCYQAYHQLGKSGKPIVSKEHTVLACIVESGHQSDRVVALATGTKCFPSNHPDGHIVDCHAESLLKRCFKRYLIELAMEWAISQQGPIEDPGAQFQEQVLQSLRYQLFVSQTPCGCVSRWQGDYNRPESESLDQQPTRSVLPIHHRPVGVNRKPGRGDSCLKAACIHKLAKWNLFGWQGAKLGSLLGNRVIRVESIVVGDCESNSGQFNWAEMSHRLTLDPDELYRVRQIQLDTNLPEVGLLQLLGEARLPEIKFAANFRYEEFVRSEGKRPAPSSIVGWLRPVGQLEQVNGDGPRTARPWQMYSEVGAVGRKLGSSCKRPNNNLTVNSEESRRVGQLAVSTDQIGLQFELLARLWTKLTGSSKNQTENYMDQLKKAENNYRTSWKFAIQSLSTFAGWPLSPGPNESTEALIPTKPLESSVGLKSKESSVPLSTTN